MSKFISALLGWHDFIYELCRFLCVYVYIMKKKKLKAKGYPIIKVSVIKHAENSNLYAPNSRAPDHRTLGKV